MQIMTDRALLESCHLAPPQIVWLSLDLAGEGVPPALTPEALADAVRERIRGQEAIK
jgi:hypothetical protein